MSDKVLAKVGDKEITQSEVDRLLGGLDPQMAMQFQNPEGQKRIVEELVNQELVYLQALENKLDQSEEFQKELKMVEEGLLKQFAIKEIIENVVVSDQDAKEFYDENQPLFIKPEMVTASHILVETKEEAEKIAKEIEEGLAFADAAAKYSNCPSNVQGGNLGEFGKGMMVPEFEAAAFTIDLDTVSEPVRTDHGYHLILVTNKEAEGTQEFDFVKENIKHQLLGMKQQEKFMEETEKLKDKYTVEVNL